MESGETHALGYKQWTRGNTTLGGGCYTTDAPYSSGQEKDAFIFNGRKSVSNPSCSERNFNVSNVAQNLIHMKGKSWTQITKQTH